ncbi:hypothetical protein ACFRCG_02645 [Embleya sp. NPDC056575]
MSEAAVVGVPDARTVEFVTELPRNPGGKVLKFELRARAAEEEAARH